MAAGRLYGAAGGVAHGDLDSGFLQGETEAAEGGFVGFILGIVGLSNPAAKGKAIWGIVLNVLAVVICIALVILYALGLVTLSILQES